VELNKGAKPEEKIAKKAEREDQSAKSAPNEEEEKSEKKFNLVEFLFCFIGLVVSYIAWGFFQERILTKPYLSTSTGNEDKFTNGEFLVFCNRIGSVLAGNVGIYFTAPHESYAPPFLYSFCAMSNVLSSWFQYEALKFITFPMQVLAKSCKIVATMGMGYFMNAKTYSVGQILTALTITVGLIVFKVGQSTGNTDDHELSPFFWLGMVLISCLHYCRCFHIELARKDL